MHARSPRDKNKGVATSEDSCSDGDGGERASERWRTGKKNNKWTASETRELQPWGRQQSSTNGAREEERVYYRKRGEEEGGGGGAR